MSSVKENKRIIEEVKNRFHSLDMVVFSATSHKTKKEYTETQEGFEFSFALSYLSKFVLSFGFKELLEKSDAPIIVNVCAPGMNGTVDLNDIQNKNNYTGSKARYHGSRLNDLLGVAFANTDTVRKIKFSLDKPPKPNLTAYIQRKEVSLTKKTFARENAQRLYKNTVQLLEGVMEK